MIVYHHLVDLPDNARSPTMTDLQVISESWIFDIFDIRLPEVVTEFSLAITASITCSHTNLIRLVSRQWLIIKQQKAGIASVNNPL